MTIQLQSISLDPYIQHKPLPTVNCAVTDVLALCFLCSQAILDLPVAADTDLLEATEALTEALLALAAA